MYNFFAEKYLKIQEIQHFPELLLHFSLSDAPSNENFAVTKVVLH